MSSALTLLLAASLVAAPLPSSASISVPPGPLARAVSAHAERLAKAPSPPPVQPAGGIELRWAELGPVLSGQRVTVVLKDGSRVIGDAVIVRDDALVLDVKRVSGSSSYTGNNAPVPRAGVARIEMERHGGAGKTLGVVLGVLTGVVLGGWIAGETADSAGVGIPLFLAIASGLTVGGYYVGKHASRQVTVITVAD